MERLDIFLGLFFPLQDKEITCGGWNFKQYLYNLRNTGLNSASTEASCLPKLLSINLTDTVSMCSVRSLRKHYCSFGICWFYSCAFLNEMLFRNNERNVWLMSWLETSPHKQLSSALLLYIDCLTLLLSVLKRYLITNFKIQSKIKKTNHRNN